MRGRAQPACRFLNCLSDVLFVGIISQARDKRSQGGGVSACVLAVPPGSTVDAMWDSFRSPGAHAIPDLPQQGGLKRDDGLEPFTGCRVVFGTPADALPVRRRGLSCAAGDAAAAGVAWSEPVALAQGGQIVALPQPRGAPPLPAAVQLSAWAGTAVVVVRTNGSPHMLVPRPAPRVRLSARMRRVTLSLFDYDRGIGDPKELDGRCARARV